MSRPRLLPAQQQALKEWAGAGLEIREVQSKAALFSPPFEVSRYSFAYYRKLTATHFIPLAKDAGLDALTTGLALREVRVKKLAELAALLEKDILGKGRHLWVTDVKAAGGELVEVEKFNASEVEQYRGILDDLAKETGGRKAEANIKQTIVIDDAAQAALKKIYGDPDANVNA